MSEPHDPTPMGTPIPGGNCPSCGAFLWVSVRSRPPVALPAGPGAAAPPPGCCRCPQCGRDLFLAIAARPALAPPARADQSALVPKTDPRLATTRRRRRL